MSDARLAGRVALITGGSRGIGAAIAEAFADAGARVIICSRKQAGLDELAHRLNGEGPQRVWAMPCHVGRPDEVRALLARARAEVGRVDVLVNNAAANPYFGPALHTPDAAFEKTFEVNVRGPFQLCRAVAAELMAAEAPGSLINISSIFGLTAAPFQATYAMTKAALISMTRTLAAEWGRAGVRVNAIAPGLVETHFAEAIVGNPEFLRVYNERAPLGRHAQPHEIAGAALFLASDESAYVTGQVLRVDGGFTAT